MQRVAESSFGKSVRQLFLVDHMFVCLAFEQARAKDYRLLCLIRRFASYLLARNIRASVRWMPSELNNADEGSRLADEAYDPSKELTRYILVSKIACGDSAPQLGLVLFAERWLLDRSWNRRGDFGHRRRERRARDVFSRRGGAGA